MWDKILLGCAIATTAGAVYGYVSGQSTEFTCLWLVATAVLLTITVIIRGVRLRAKKRYVQELEAQVQQQKEQIVAVQKAGKDELASFYSTLSHTLRMPLSIVRGYAELLEGGIVTDHQVAQEYLKKILQHTQYISETITGNLQNVRADSSTSMICTQVDIVDMAQQMAQDMRNSAESCGITINVINAEDKLFIYADVYQLTRMFLNVLENAIKYMRREGMIAITVTQLENAVRIMIKDDGVGLPEEELSGIFDDKYCGSNSTEGSGHGLFIVKNVVQAHHGSIEARSGLGQGMGIIITLPINQPTAVSDNTEKTPAI
ncbi:MAG: HAMP domain-containing sensor histidine kinase [Oscillospiraceae bacterium]